MIHREANLGRVKNPVKDELAKGRIAEDVISSALRGFFAQAAIIDM
jgi:hypothetical protein